MEEPVIDMEEARRIFEEGMAQKKMKLRWELEKSYDKDFIFEVAKLRGWYDEPPKVQVKHFYEQKSPTTVREYWTIEHYEEDCHCPNLVPRPPLTED
jgi:deoxyribodipyrimidine photolyase-like uncharacterized protein